MSNTSTSNTCISNKTQCIFQCAWGRGIHAQTFCLWNALVCMFNDRTHTHAACILHVRTHQSMERATHAPVLHTRTLWLRLPNKLFPIDWCAWCLQRLVVVPRIASRKQTSAGAPHTCFVINSINISHLWRDGDDVVDNCVCVRVGVGGDGNVHDYYEQFNVCAYNYLEIESGAISMRRCAFICLCCTRSAITFYTSCMTDELHESGACSSV